MSNAVKQQKKKRILTALVVVGLLLIGAGYYAAYYYKSIIKRAIPIAVAEATDSMYHMSVANVGINLLNRRIVLKGVKIWPDSARVAMKKRTGIAAKNYFEIVVPKLKVAGIMWDQLTGGDGYSCSDFIIYNPSIKIFSSDSLESAYDTSSRAAPGHPFTVSNLQLISADIQYILRKGRDSSEVYVHGCNTKMRDWDLSEESLADMGRFLLAEQASIDVDSLELIDPASLFRLSTGAIHYDNEYNKLIVTDFRFRLRVKPTEYNRAKGMQSDLFHLHFPTTEIAGIDHGRLFARRQFVADAVYLTQAYVSDYMDRQQPANTRSKMGNFPSQILQKLKLPLAIGLVKVKEGKVIYSESHPREGGKASIYFTGIHGEVANVTNMPEFLAKDSTARVSLKGFFNGSTPMSGNMVFALRDKAGGFSVGIHMGELYGRQINKQVNVLANMETRSFHMTGMTASISGNEQGASGSFEMQYTNLAIKLLRKPQSDSAQKEKGKGLITFIANNLILYSANPMPGQPVRRVNTAVQRDPYKSFFNLVWNNVKQGVKYTTVRDMGVVDWMQANQKDADKKPLKNIFRRKNRKDKKRDE